MQRTGEELGNVDAKCWPNALAQVLEWNNSCLQSQVAQKQESTNTILDNIQLYEYSIGVLSLCVSMTWILKPIMSGSLHNARTQKQETPGVVKTFPHYIGGPTLGILYLCNQCKPSPGSSAHMVGLGVGWGSHGQGSSDQTRQCRHNQVLLRRTKFELSKGPCEKPCVSRRKVECCWASCELKRQ